MNKKITLLFVITCILFTGCFANNNDATKKFINKVEKSKSYYLSGELEIVNNEDIYLYDVDVSYKDNDYFKVELTNQTNNHKQIILKNEEGVYVLTPSLNKSFKFQSEWPYNNSQSYLLQSLVTDIQNDKNKKIEKKDNHTIVTTDVNYSNNKKLKEQKIYFNKSSLVDKVEVYDEDQNVKIKMTFQNIDLKAKYNDDYFKVESNMDTNQIKQTSNEIEDIVYPMYMPENTYLASEDKINIESGERAILTFSGEKPFTIIQETVTVSEEIEQINMYGEPAFLKDTIGSLSENSITWISNGIEYYATSDVMNETELIEIVKSIGTLPVSK